MMYSINKFDIILFIYFLIFLTFNPGNTQISCYSEFESKIYAKYAKLVGCSKKPIMNNSPICINPGDGFKFYFYYQITPIKKFDYKFLIHHNN